ncbi:putative uncharacterized protein DDB_G0282133 [Frieseomelitta varia]|uniref:putative uncharacterized protein DDB_G0282133 n=1 Tax=Frieseomelitta varia TaxID=561572 RepID=UPI001CB6AA4C|nr:putative uncharacterized protein DDB_G0282133 [Frieseomelitta varia]
MESDIDIYADLPDFGPEFSKNFVSENEENTAEKQLELKKQIAELTAKLENSEKVNKNLEINLFSLLKTAKAEITRKDKMIDDLRKRLDDVTFRRSSYSNNYVIRKSTLSTTVTNTHQKSIDICFSVNEKSTQMSNSNSLSNQSKDQQNKSTLVPITVFGERLLKRMMDEQNLEKKDRSNKLNNSDNDDKNNAGYTVESDKENGFSCDTNFDNTKEIQSSVIAQYKGSENLLAGSGSTTKDVQLNNKNEMSSTFQRKSTFTYTGKRANEEENRHIHVKRMKPSGEKHCFDVTKKETDNNVVSESNEKSAFPRYNDFGFSDYSNEKGHNKKYSEYVHTSSMELKHRYSIHDANKADERRDTKNKSDKRDINDDHSLKRRKSTQNSTLYIYNSDKKDTSYRCVEAFERDNCRRSHSKYRSSRDKQKEYHRTDDHRSREKSTSYTKSYREEKYHRNQYNNKHSDHDGKFEERCNLRNSGTANKSKIPKKDTTYNDRQTKHSTIDRISTDQRFDEVKKAQCRYNEHEPRKMRNIDESIKRHDKDKQDEYSECSRSRRNSDAENLIEHPKYSQVSKKKEIDGTTQTANALEIGNEEESKNSSINLEDDEISDSRNKNSSKDTCNNYKRSKDQQDTDANLPPGDPSFAVNNTSVKSTVSNETEKALDVLRTVPILDTNIACSPGETISKNIESVENIENIEKFIRSSVSTCDKAPGNMSGITSNNASNDLQPGTVEKEMQGNANAPNASSDNAMSFVENRQTDKSVTNVANVASSENNSVKDNYTQSELRTTLLQENEHVGLNSNSELTNVDHSVNVQLKTESNVLETVRKTESQQKKHNDTSANAAGDLDIRNNCHNTDDCYEDEINQNSPEDVTNTPSTQENENASIAMEVTRGKECDKYIGKTEEIELRVFKKPLEKSINHSNNSSAKDSMNVYGKIVVFARRKKPVCLANSNANMTVLINNKHDTGVDLSTADIGRINGPDTANTSSSVVKTTNM